MLVNRSENPVVVIGAGQSGLSAAASLQTAGLRPLVVEGDSRPGGAWPHYYDSLRAFSPRRHSAIPGVEMPGDPDGYPSKAEVSAYLQRYADSLDVEIRTGSPVIVVTTADSGYTVHTADGDVVGAAAVVAASGSFTKPHLPQLPGQADFSGELLHAGRYRNPEPYAGKRVVVVGGGNSAVQIAFELSDVADVTLASRKAPGFIDQRPHGSDVHDWLTAGFDDLPGAWVAQLFTGNLVLDVGGYREAFDAERPRRRGMFAEFDGDKVVWPDGERESVDTVLFATGYRPSVEYLRGLGALDADGYPLHVGGLSTTHPGLAYLGLEFQRSFASNTLRGVARDAAHVVRPLAAYARGAHVGL